MLNLLDLLKRNLLHNNPNKNNLKKLFLHQLLNKLKKRLMQLSNLQPNLKPKLVVKLPNKILIKAETKIDQRDLIKLINDHINPDTMRRKTMQMKIKDKMKMKVKYPSSIISK